MKGAMSWGTVCVCLLSACSTEERVRELVPAGFEQQLPVDSTAPGELAESEHKAFGFPVPREMKIEARLDDTWYAYGNMRLEAVANYVRERVEADLIETGPNKTVFLNAVIKATPKLRVQIEVSRKRGGVEMVVRNRTRKPAEKGLTEAERWERAGLTPDGKVIEKYAQ